MIDFCVLRVAFNVSISVAALIIGFPSESYPDTNLEIVLQSEMPILDIQHILHFVNPRFVPKELTPFERVVYFSPFVSIQEEDCAICSFISL